MFALQGTYTAYSNVSITAPENGYVVVELVGDVITSADPNVAYVGLGTSATTADLYHIYVGQYYGTGTGTKNIPVTLQAVYPVSAGTKYNFYCGAYQWSGIDTVYLSYIYMTATFYQT